MLLLQQGEAPFLIMGVPIYLDYYAVHDDNQDRIGFTSQNGGNKKGPYAAEGQPWMHLSDASRRGELENVKTAEMIQIEDK